MRTASPPTRCAAIRCSRWRDYGFQPIVVFDGAGRFVTAVLRPARRPEGREIAAHLCRLIREIRSQADHKVAPITLIRNQSGDPRRRVTNGIGMWTVIVSSSAEAVVRSTPPPS